MIDLTNPNFKRLLRDLVILLAVTLAMMAAVVRGDSVKLLGFATTAEPTVKLRDVAELSGDGAKALGDTVVGEVKADARESSVSLDSVREKLTQRGVNWGTMSLGGYAICRIEKPPTEVAHAAIAANPSTEVTVNATLTVREKIVELMAKLTGVDRADLKVTFAEGDAKVTALSTLTSRFEFEPESATGLGRVPIVVRRWSGDKLVETLRVTADVSRRCLAVVTTHEISRGQTFAPSDIDVQEVYTDGTHGKPLSDPAGVIGQNAALALRKGSIIYGEGLRSPVVVKRGDVMSVRCISGGMVVKTSARATENGSIDQVIQARNERSRETFLVRVTGPMEGTLMNTAADPDKPKSGDKKR